MTRRDLPPGAEPLARLALDLRWTWSHAGDALWSQVDPDLWERTRNPWVVLDDVPRARLEELVATPGFREELERMEVARRTYLSEPGWYGEVHAASPLRCVAYFSLEFGLGDALPLYAGGLGILAGDCLKTASDLKVPMVGVGLLYQEGYFRQIIDAAGRQQEAYPYNDPSGLPIRPVTAPDGGWLQVPLDLPGRTLLLRVWEAQVGAARLLLLDSNDPLNSPNDRGVTSKLYGGGREMRLLQEAALGIGGWQALRMLGIEPDVCHLNEGHAALLVVERARRFMELSGCDFWQALWATRAGNVFTTHTAVAAAFDVYPPELLLQYGQHYLPRLRVSAEELLGLGRRDPQDGREPFNMAYLAARGCLFMNGVSRLHGEVSRRLFQVLFPRWPEAEVPVTHVTNGVHVPSWDSPAADALWTRACGKRRWLGDLEALACGIEAATDEELWSLRAEGRRSLVEFARRRLAGHLGRRNADPARLERAAHVLDPNVLTVGLARRFTDYKRPDLLLRDRERLVRLLTHADRPVQLIVAGKAHPEDELGKRMVSDWVAFVRRHEVRERAVFLEDYDMAMAQELVQGVDLWLNTPRSPMEACGTSGMKVLANGSLNLSALDGWWAEAYAPEVGWAFGGGAGRPEPAWDAAEAEQIYGLLEREVVPEFYARDERGLPRAWLRRVRASMSRLGPRYSSNRMVREYVERLYLPAMAAYRSRSNRAGELARALCDWERGLRHRWQSVRFGNVEACAEGSEWLFRVQVYLGEIPPEHVQVQLYADALPGTERVCVPMERDGAFPGAAHGYTYLGRVSGQRPAAHYTPRVIPWHPEARLPLEAGFILWDTARAG